MSWPLTWPSPGSQYKGYKLKNGTIIEMTEPLQDMK